MNTTWNCSCFPGTTEICPAESKSWAGRKMYSLEDKLHDHLKSYLEASHKTSPSIFSSSLGMLTVWHSLLLKMNLILKLMPAAFVFRACQGVTKSHLKGTLPMCGWGDIHKVKQWLPAEETLLPHLPQAQFSMTLHCMNYFSPIKCKAEIPQQQPFQSLWQALWKVAHWPTHRRTCSCKTKLLSGRA